MKATTLLERQHRDLQQLCEAVECGSASVRASLLPQLAGDLVAHIAVEELVFYPAACRALREEAWARESSARDALARRSLERALRAALDGDEFTRAIGELRGIVERHVEAEEALLFPLLERVLSPPDSRQLASAMMALYHVKVEAGYPRPQEPVARP